MPSPLEGTALSTSTPAIFPLAIEGTPVPFPEMPISVDNADRLAELARWGKGWPQAADLSPDDALLAIGASAGLYIYDLDSHTEVRFPIEASVNDVAFSPNGRQVASATDTGLQLWDVETGRLLLVFDEEGPVFSVAFSPDGDLLAAGGHRAVRVWNAVTGEAAATIGADTQTVWTVAFSPDGSMLASGGWFEEGEYSLQLWNLRGPSVRFNLVAEPHHTQRQVAFSPDGRILASASDAQVRLWNTTTGELLGTLQHPGTASGVAFSPDGRTLFTAGEGLRSWDLDGRELNVFGAFADEVFVTADGSTLISFHGPEIRYWDATTGAPDATQQLPGYTDLVDTVAFSPDGKTLASGGWDDIIRLWDVAAGRVRRSIEAGLSGVNTVAFSPDGRVLAAGGCGTLNTGPGRRCLQGGIALRDGLTGDPIREIPADASDVVVLAFSPDGSLLASNGADAAIWVWHIASGQLLSRAGAAGYPFAFTPNGETLVSVYEDSLRFFDVATGRVVDTFPCPRPDLSMAISPDGQLIATADYYDYSIYIWNASTGTVFHTLEGHEDRVVALAFSPDGLLLASSGFDGGVRLWSMASGRLVRAVDAPARYSPAMTFSPDGLLLASGDFEGTVTLWGVR